MNCLTDMSMKLQEMCYDPSITHNSTDYDKKNPGKDGKKGPVWKKNSQGVSGMAIGVDGFVPSFTAMINSNQKSSNDKANSQLEQASFKSETLFNKVVEQRDRKNKEKMKAMSAKDKELNDQFNKGLTDINQLSPAAITAIMGAGALNKDSNSNLAKNIENKNIVAPKTSAPIQDTSPGILLPPTQGKSSGSSEDNQAAMNDVELEKMIQEAKDDKYNPNDGDGLFKIISKGYMKHGLHRLLKKKEIDQGEKEKFSPPKTK